MPAHEVIEVLNDYLTEMVDAILDNGGTLVAYMGDGIMAVFGAPIEAGRPRGPSAHRGARDAPRTAAAVQPVVDGEWLSGWLSMGIGLSSGPLMSGTVGSSRRLEYTAIGDTTNTASRLESMTKRTPHSDPHIRVNPAAPTAADG